MISSKDKNIEDNIEWFSRLNPCERIRIAKKKSEESKKLYEIGKKFWSENEKILKQRDMKK